MEFLLFVMKVFLVVTIAVKAEEKEETCIVYSKIIRFNLHGEILPVGRDIDVTECMVKVITANSPISFNEYTDYLIISHYNGPISKVYRNSFSLMPNLKTLLMTNEVVNELEAGAFNGLSNLRYLSLKLNNLRSLPQNVFDDVPSLVELNLSHNQLTKIERHLFDNLGNLKTLLLNYNKITELEGQWYTGLGSLQYLGLISNRLPKVKTMDYYGLHNLETLRIQENDINIVERDGFKGLVNLKNLSIHNENNNNNDVPNMVEFDLKHELDNMPKLEALSLSRIAYECGVIPSAQEYLKNASRTVEFMNIPEIEGCWDYSN